MKTKRIIAILAVIAALACLAGCAVKPAAEVGSKLSDNIARLWFPDERESRFVLDCVPIEGSVTGQAFLDPAADGKSALAWVDLNAYFVSEKGVDPLGGPVSPAIISFDGSCAVYQSGEELMLYSSETRSSSAIADGLSSVQQIAVSPASRAIAFTAQIKDGGVDRHSFLYKDGALTPIFEGRNVIVMAVSDDASVVYYYDFDFTSFCVDYSGQSDVIAENLSSDTNFNFTRDLSEVAYRDGVGTNHLFRLSDHMNADLGTGFQYTLKTDIYSASTTNVITYINDVDTFTGGLWLKRETVDDIRLYSVGLMNDKGEIDWLSEHAASYAASSDGRSVVTLAGNTLSSVDMKGKSKELAKDVTSFAMTDDGSFIYYISNAGTLFGIKGSGKPAKLATGASNVKVSGGACFCLTDVSGEGDAACGTLQMFRGLEGYGDPLKNVSSIDRRNGQLIAYLLPADDSGKPAANYAEDGSLLTEAWFTYDGSEFKLLGENVGK